MHLEGGRDEMDGGSLGFEESTISTVLNEAFVSTMIQLLRNSRQKQSSAFTAIYQT